MTLFIEKEHRRYFDWLMDDSKIMRWPGPECYLCYAFLSSLHSGKIGSFYDETPDRKRFIEKTSLALTMFNSGHPRNTSAYVAYIVEYIEEWPNALPPKLSFFGAIVFLETMVRDFKKVPSINEMIEAMRAFSEHADNRFDDAYTLRGECPLNCYDFDKMFNLSDPYLSARDLGGLWQHLDMSAVDDSPRDFSRAMNLFYDHVHERWPELPGILDIQPGVILGPYAREPLSTMFVDHIKDAPNEGWPFIPVTVLALLQFSEVHGLLELERLASERPLIPVKGGEVPLVLPSDIIAVNKVVNTLEPIEYEIEYEYELRDELFKRLFYDVIYLADDKTIAAYRQIASELYPSVTQCDVLEPDDDWI